MKDWNDRTTEEANLLNPAFCSHILAAAVLGYLEESDQDMPYFLSLLVMPLILYKPTRSALPRDTRSYFINWIQDNQIAKTYIHQHILSLRNHTQESFLFGIQYSLISLSNEGQLSTSISKSKLNSIIKHLAGEAKECIKKAFFLGKWFAKTGEPHFIYTLLGIKL